MIPLRDNMRIKEFPLLTVLLVVINVGVFFAWQGGTDTDIGKILLYGNVPYEVSNPGTQCMPSQTIAYTFECDETALQEHRWRMDFPPTWLTFFTSMFMHISLSHLIGNMLFLVVFGLALEAGLGRASFLLFYVVGGLGADVGHIVFDPGSKVPALGASGAISAVVGGYLMLFPKAKMFTWIVPPLPFLWGWLRANLVIGVYMGMQVLLAYFAMAAAYGSGDNTAYFAHFGGFLAGIGLVKLVVDAETVESLRRQARLASGDERRVVEHIETPPGQPAPHPSYPYMTPQHAAGPPGAQTVAGQSPLYAGPTSVPGPPQSPSDPFAPNPHQTQPDPFAPPSAQTPASAAVPPDPFAPRSAASD